MPDEFTPTLVTAQKLYVRSYTIQRWDMSGYSRSDIRRDGDGWSWRRRRPGKRPTKWRKAATFAEASDLAGP